VLLRQTVCHRLYSHVLQFIVQSTSLAAICHAVLGRFVNVSRRFEWSQSHQILGQSAYEVCTLQRLRSVGSPLSEPQTSPPPLSHSLSLTYIRPAASSVFFGASPIGCSARSYTARSDPSLFPTQKPAFYMTLIQCHSDHTNQVRGENVTKCGKR